MTPESKPGRIYHFPSWVCRAMIPAGIQDKDWNCSANYDSCQDRHRATFCCDCSRKVPVCAQQEFHCWTQNLLTMDLLLIAFPYFFIRIVLQVIVSCHLIGSLSNSKTQSSPCSHYILAVNVAQLRVVTWLFWLQGETFHYCRFCYIYLPRYKKLWYWYSPNFIGL